MYSDGEADWTTRVCTPRSFSAFFRPTNARWLNPRSLRPPMSVISPTLKDDAGVVVVDAVVVVVVAAFFEPHPAAVTARSTTSVSMSGFFTVSLSGVLDCGTKTLADSTHHALI